MHLLPVTLALISPLMAIAYAPTKGPTPLVTSSDIQGTNFINRQVRFVGFVEDVIPDELDEDYWFLVVSDDKGKVYAPIHTLKNQFYPREYFGATVEFHAKCFPTSTFAKRNHMSRILAIESLTDIRIISKALDAPFNAPVATSTVKAGQPPNDIVGKGRVRDFGTIIALKSNQEALMLNNHGKVMRLEFVENDLPTNGATVEVVGQLETDMTRLNLSRCLWRPTTKATSRIPPARNINIHDIINTKGSRTIYSEKIHGENVRICGVVQSIPNLTTGEHRLFVKSDNYTICVDMSQFSTLPHGLEVNAFISVTGICWQEIDNWRSSATFPQVRGFSIVPAGHNDFVILSSPPWWTPQRLLFVVGLLIVILGATLVWTFFLRLLSEKRGRDLFKEQIAHVSAELRVNERTRLAVEIHDTISQNLTGVALEIDAGHYETAQRMLKSSRDELRNCLWDLRNDTLGATSVEEAIRMTLSPHLRGIRCLIRFPVARSLFTDSTAHAILKIIRELTINAIRHGKATEIRVAGSIEGNRLLFSVRDNGCGFDPKTAPGLAEGHFGLQGIRERIAEFDGEIEISSDPGIGTKVTLAIGIKNKQGIGT